MNTKEYLRLPRVIVPRNMSYRCLCSRMAETIPVVIPRIGIYVGDCFLLLGEPVRGWRYDCACGQKVRSIIQEIDYA